MTETLEQFKNETLGGSYGNPGTNTFVGECVSYVRQKMERVDGVPTKPVGNAKDYWNNPYILQYYDQVSSPQQGDIGVSGATVSNPFGHIWNYYNGQMLSQNYNVPKRVTLFNGFPPKVLGYLRLKGATPGGDKVVTSKEYADLLTMLTTGWPSPHEDGGAFSKSLEGQDLDMAGLSNMLRTMLNTPQHIDLINLAIAGGNAKKKFKPVGTNSGLFEEDKS